LVSARAQDQFVAATYSHDTIVSSWSSTNSTFKKEPAGRAAGFRFIGKRRAPGATAIWKASFVPSVEAIRRSAFACSFGLRLDQLDRPSLVISRRVLGFAAEPSAAGDQRAVTFY